MKILHLSNTPLSNAPANLAQIQRDARHDSKVLLARQSNLNKVFVGGELWTGRTTEELEDLCKNTEIIHFHNFAFEQEIFRQHPSLVEVCKKKPCLIQYHSPRHSTESFEETLNDPFFRGRRAVIAQYHVRQYPEAWFVVPNVIPLFDRRFMPLMAPPCNNPPRLSFAPSSVNGKDWEDKGYLQTRTTLLKLERAGLIQADIITNTPYEEMLIRKKWADIGMEEIVTGSYHMSYLEYMALGVATFCRMDMLTQGAMAMVVGKDAVKALPSIPTHPDTFEQDLHDYLQQPGLIAHHGKMSRLWMEQYWNPTTFVRHFENIYASL